MTKDVKNVIINKAMKDFRPTQKFAKENGETINSIFYLGERLSPTQVSIIKEAIDSFILMNKEIGKDATDNIIKELMTQVMMEQFLNNLSK